MCFCTVILRPFYVKLAFFDFSSSVLSAWRWRSRQRSRLIPPASGASEVFPSGMIAVGSEKCE